MVVSQFYVQVFLWPCITFSMSDLPTVYRFYQLYIGKSYSKICWAEIHIAPRDPLSALDPRSPPGVSQAHLPWSERCGTLAADLVLPRRPDRSSAVAGRARASCGGRKHECFLEGSWVLLHPDQQLSPQGWLGAPMELPEQREAGAGGCGRCGPALADSSLPAMSALLLRGKAPTHLL